MASHTYTINSSNYNVDNTIYSVVGDSISILATHEQKQGANGYNKYGIWKYHAVGNVNQRVNIPGCTYTASDSTITVHELNGTLTTAGTYVLTKALGVTEGGKLTLIVTDTPIEYTITFNSDGGSINPSAQTVSRDNSITLPSPGTKSGYVFNGWYNGSTYVGMDGSSYTPTASVTLTASWSALVYKLIFNVGSGSGGPANQTVESSASSYRIQIPYDEPIYSGWKFKGWDTSSNAATVVYNPGDYVRLYSDSPTLTLYAVWVRVYTFTLSYSANGGSGAPSSETYTSETAPYSFRISYTEPTRTNYKFIGWSTSSSGDVEYNPGDWIDVYLNSSASLVGTVTLYAVWKAAITYTMVFDLDGGTGGPSTQTVTSFEDEVQIMIPYEIPTMKGYRFKGWILDEDPQSGILMHGGEYVTFRADQLTTMHMQAKWEKVYTYTMLFDLDGGTGGPSTQIVESPDEEVRIMIPYEIPVKEKQEFYGWMLDEENSAGIVHQGGEYITFRYDQLLTMTMRALWRDKRYRYTLVYDANGGSGAPSGETVETEDDLGEYVFTISLTVPQYNSNIFIGWEKENSSDNTLYVPGGDIDVASDTTVRLIAKWMSALTDDDFESRIISETQGSHGRCYMIVQQRRDNGVSESDSKLVVIPIVGSFDHTFTANLIEMPTLIYGSENNFVTDTGVIQRFNVHVERRNPNNIDDSLEFPVLDTETGAYECGWSNKKWWEEFLKTIDYWQNFGYVIENGDRIRKGGFTFVFEPSDPHSYPQIHRNVFISGAITPTFYVDRLTFALPLVVSRMENFGESEDMYGKLYFNYTFSNSAYVSTKIVTSRYVPITVPSFTQGEYTVSEWKCTDSKGIAHTFAPGDRLYCVPYGAEDFNSPAVHLDENNELRFTATVVKFSVIGYLIHKFDLSNGKFVKNLTHTFSEGFTSDDYTGRIQLSAGTYEIVYWISGGGGGGGSAEYKTSNDGDLINSGLLEHLWGGGGGGSSEVVNGAKKIYITDGINYKVGKGGEGSDVDSDRKGWAGKSGESSFLDFKLIYDESSTTAVKAIGGYGGACWIEGQKPTGGKSVDGDKTSKGGGTGGINVRTDGTDGSSFETSLSKKGYGGGSYYYRNSVGQPAKAGSSGGGGGGANIGAKMDMDGKVFEVVSTGGHGSSMTVDGSTGGVRTTTDSIPGVNGAGGGGGSVWKRRATILSSTELKHRPGAQGGMGFVMLYIRKYEG